MSKIKESSFYKLLEVRKSSLLTNVDKLIDYCTSFLPNIVLVFQNYTRHDIEHSYNVLQYMYHLCDYPEELSDYDIILCIASALLHDIGMVSNNEEISRLKTGKIDMYGKKYSKVRQRVNDDFIAVQECIRPVHALRSKKHILESMDETFFCINGNISFRDELSNICLSHNMPFVWITDPANLDTISFKGDFEGNPSFISVLLRLADYLDIDTNRTPIDLFNYLQLKDISLKEWKMNLSIENTCDNKIKIRDGVKEIILSGKTTDPIIHRKLINYIASLENEISQALEYTRKLDNKYKLTIFPKVQELIKTDGFTFSNFKLQLDYNSVTNLLMGEHIYGDKKYGLREIIQNSIDACHIMKEISLNLDDYKITHYEPKITITFNKADNKIIITDNGIGMTLDVVKNNFLNVGVSYYNSYSFLDYDFDYQPIGRYGIGFLSCFMLSSQINVITRHYDDQSLIELALEKNNEFITISLKNDVRVHGTRIALSYSDFVSVFPSINEVQNFIKRNFLSNKIDFIINEEIDSGYQSSSIQLIEPDNGKFNIDLSKYLKFIEVKLSGAISNDFIINELSQIDKNESYIYDDNNENTLLKAKDVLLADYIKDNRIIFLSLYHVDSSMEEEYSKALDVLEDTEEAIKKVSEHKLNIFTRPNDIYSTGTIDESDYIINDYYVSDFESQFDHCKDTGTIAEENKTYFIENGTNNYLIYHQDKESTYRWFSSNERDNDHIFIKDVYISKSQIVIPYIARGIKIKSFFVNIRNETIFPELSRNDISATQMKLLNHTIGRALHLWILDNIDLTVEQRNLLIKFISEKYDKTELCV